jgi:nucleolar protein 15
MAPLKKGRVRGTPESMDVGSKPFLALEGDDQKDFERRVADHKKKMSTASSSGAASGSNVPGVVYLGHVPHGFYEKEMKSFFSQFGRVTRLRLSRSKRTGRSKGYAFLEFQHQEVAQVAADTMNNYLMFRQILKCEFVPADKLHPDTFKNSHRPFFAPTTQKKSRERHNAEKTPKAEAAKTKKRMKKLNRKMTALEDAGIDFQCRVEGDAVVSKKEDRAMLVDDEPAATETE